MGLKGPEAKEMFEVRYGSEMNFITPHPEEYFMLYEDIAIEISSGAGLNHNTIYGITVLYRCPKGKIVHLANDSVSCKDRIEVDKYIKELKSKFRKPSNRKRAIVTDYEDC